MGRSCQTRLGSKISVEDAVREAQDERARLLDLNKDGWITLKELGF
ncbi:MAG: hypothetical protein K1X67_20035 [Fimbriimonadaceae bacterium]|nr:hypothetical protein [Fimbriimonadaceae bacterium]